MIRTLENQRMINERKPRASGDDPAQAILTTKDFL